MGTIVREFMTHWDSKGPIWYERDEEELIGTQRSGGRPMPRIRMLDLFRGPTNLDGNQPILVWSGEDAVIEAHYTEGAEPHFHRPADYDVLIFQYSGRAVVETEMGEFPLGVAHCVHVPAGVAYRAIGGPESRQMVVKVHEPFELGVNPGNPLTETVFDVRMVDGMPDGQAVQPPADKLANSVYKSLWIMTSHRGDELSGSMVFSALSLYRSNPVKFVVCVTRHDYTHDVVMGSGVFALHALRED